MTKPKTYSLDLITNIRQAIDEDSLPVFDKIKLNIGLNRNVLFGHALGQILFNRIAYGTAEK